MQLLGPRRINLEALNSQDFGDQSQFAKSRPMSANNDRNRLQATVGEASVIGSWAACRKRLEANQPTVSRG